MVIAYPAQPLSTLKWFFLLVAVLLGNVVLDLSGNVERPDELAKQKYHVIEKARERLNGRVVIETYKHTSRLQCRHRCNRNKGCYDVTVNSDDVCVLLGEDEGGYIVTTGGMETISKVKFPGKLYILFGVTAYETRMQDSGPQD